MPGALLNGLVGSADGLLADKLAAAQAQSDRIAIFRERFAPKAIFERFLRPALATATVAAALASTGSAIAEFPANLLR